jgi:hypothetical protein
MTPKDLARARERLGLSLFEMATMLGYLGEQRDQMMHDLTTGRRPIREPQRRLIEAYLSGYRPADWPNKKE